MRKDVYGKCPVYETESFRLEPVKMEHAGELLDSCYSDSHAAERANTDGCTSDFFFYSLKQMQDCIAFWIREYKDRRYVRFTVFSRNTGKAVGTAEIFGGETGILRIDFGMLYDTEKYIEEIVRLAVLEWIYDFQIQSLKCKVGNVRERIPVLARYGFVPDKTFRTESEYYERQGSHFFDAKKGMAYCGLACCVCSENAGCEGCRNEGCKDKNWCKAYHCCKRNELDGCWKCEEFPCNNNMLKKLRIRTFAKFLNKYGEAKMLNALEKNEQDGVLYHYKSKLKGDYDLLGTEDEITSLLLRGLEE